MLAGELPNRPMEYLIPQDDTYYFAAAQINLLMIALIWRFMPFRPLTRDVVKLISAEAVVQVIGDIVRWLHVWPDDFYNPAIHGIVWVTILWIVIGRVRYDKILAYRPGGGIWSIAVCSAHKRVQEMEK